MTLGGFGLGARGAMTPLERSAMPDCYDLDCDRPVSRFEWGACRLDPDDDESPWVPTATAICPAGHRVRLGPPPPACSA